MRETLDRTAARMLGQKKRIAGEKINKGILNVARTSARRKGKAVIKHVISSTEARGDGRGGDNHGWT